MIHHTDDDDHDTQHNSQDSTIKYLNHIEESLYADIKQRESIDSGLMFLSCQITSTSVAWIFASMQISTSIMLAASITISLVPGIVDAGESFRAELSSDRWEIYHDKPLIAISKLIIGGTISWNSSQAIARDYWRTESNISSVYSDIRNNNNKGWYSMPMIDALPFLIAMAIGSAFILFRLSRNDPKQ